MVILILRTARVVGTPTPNPIGTFHYMAPEMMRCDDGYAPTSAADVWSFGVIVWQMITLSTPYPGKEAPVVSFQVAMSKLRPIIPGRVTAFWTELLTGCFREAGDRPLFEEVSINLGQHTDADADPSWLDDARK